MMFSYGIMLFIPLLLLSQNLFSFTEEDVVLVMICEVFFGYHFVILLSRYHQLKNDSSSKAKANSFLFEEYFEAVDLMQVRTTNSHVKMDAKSQKAISNDTNAALKQFCELYI